ncbi:transforming acidic coiled-coil-containing protein 2-like [Oppia nitens]|uniref:transforming acidic coiled-coil-containing protein 2-like n=1 Tax=Oppia nitens TaxID=1686743 RepID=UPI0023DC38C1|nr:transforming acidic coiled-coil-containing protein 2-like [Oppia nitens]
MNSFDVNGFNDSNDYSGDGHQTIESPNRVITDHNNHVFTDDDFKIPEKFIHELDALEKKTLINDVNNGLSPTRMSLLKRFDPLVDTMNISDLIRRTNTMTLNDSLRSQHNITIAHQRLNETIDGHEVSPMRHNESTALMNFNTPLNVTNVGLRGEQLTEENGNHLIDDISHQLIDELRTKELLFQEKLIEKDKQIYTLEESINRVAIDCDKYELLVNLLHKCNEDLVETASETINNLLADKNDMIEKCNEMTAERSQALKEVDNVEKNFYEVHNRYDKVRTALEDSKLRELQFNEQLNELMDRLKEKDQMYDMLKSKAEQKIEQANIMIESARKDCESELIAVKAQLKRSEMKINGLQSQLDQKTKENDELTKMVDELIANVEKIRKQRALL